MTDLGSTRADAARRPEPTGRSTIGSTTSSRPASGGSSATIPIFATYLGIHTEDHRLGDGSRDAVLGEIAAERAHLAAVEAHRPGRPVGRGPLRARPRDPQRPARRIFDAEVHRGPGSAARPPSTTSATRCSCSSPATSRRSPERLDVDRRPAGGRPRVPRASARTRAVVPQVRLWQRSRSSRPSELPVALRRDRRRRRRACLGRPERRRLRAAAGRRPRRPWPTTRTGCARSLAGGTDDWALGRERYDELVAPARLRRPRRRRDPRRSARSSSPRNKAARVAAAREIDPTRRPRPTVVDRIKSDHPATFEEALEAYRDVMVRARRHLIEHDIVTVPPTSGSTSSRRPSTSATSSRSRPTSSRRSSTRTRRASTSSRRRSATTRTRCASTTTARSATPASTRRTPATTSSCRSAVEHPSLTRLLTDAPEFVEGWGMYSEQMMREQGFDDAAELPAEHVHRRDLASLPDHPRRPDAPRRDRRRRDASEFLVERDELRGAERAGRGPPLHVHARPTS